MALTTKSVGDDVSMFDPAGTLVGVFPVEATGNGYYVVTGLYFTSGAGNGRGSIEAGWTIQDPVTDDQDRSTALATLEPISGVRWSDMSTADLQSAVTLLQDYISVGGG